MADWRQIQARIRKAKTGTDPLVKLAELFTKTHDAMVAWEMAVIEEKAGNLEAAIGHYTVAAERFRRSEWKKKAEEALTRLGAPVPVASSAAAGDSQKVVKTSSDAPADTSDDQQLTLSIPKGESEPEDSAASEPAGESVEKASAGSAGNGSAEAGSANGLRRRRRGRRGGRGRRRPGAASAPGLPAKTFAPASTSKEGPTSATPATPIARLPERVEERPAEARAGAPAPAKRTESEAPVSSMDRMSHTRPGEPALASRLAQLESLLRRLTSGPLHTLDEADDAPAGPGVFLLSDSDLITSYYVEECKTLRVALGHVVRGGRGAQRETSVRSRLADHLGINEAKVSQYLKQHCVIRWIQLDEQAPYLAHFAIAVLRPPLNFESM